jgi:hypothetical protein
MERRVGEIARDIERAVDAIVKGRIEAAAIAGNVNALHAERKDLEEKLAKAASEAQVTTVHPAAGDRAALDRLADP